MKRYFTLPLFLLLFIAAKGQTYISGFISANTTWTVAGSPYIVTGNALVSQGYTLTIDPGVVIKFDTNCALQVDGQLIAIGTAANRITFTSNQASPKAGDWANLHIADNSVNANYDANGNYLSGTILKYCDVLYAGGSGFGAMHVESASPYVSHSNIEHSKASGIYCVGSSYIIDSSLVNDCSYGLYFDNIQLNSCGLIIHNDSIVNNRSGGLFVQAPIGCITNIENNYFISNTGDGAMAFRSQIVNGTIANNYFITNIGGAINAYGGNGIRIINNSFIKNSDSYSSTYSGIVTLRSGKNITVAQNLFLSDTIVSTSDRPAVLSITSESLGAGFDTIECNSFLNNEIKIYGYGAIYFAFGDSALIRNNIFDGNVNMNPGQYSVGYFDCTYSFLHNNVFFKNNIIRNNISPSGTTCYFRPYLETNDQLLHIDHNEFKGNKASKVLYLDGDLINNSNYNFLYMKYNNFLDSNSYKELYNQIPYGSPNVMADSNYWGSTSTQHVDSIIYDYFDASNQSVVYYQPILSSPVFIDTTCSFLITPVTSIADDKVETNPFPNPFSSYTQIYFKNELKDASLLLYNVFGQKVRAAEHFSGRQIRIERGNLPGGVYVYSVIEKGIIVSSGRLAIE